MFASRTDFAVKMLDGATRAARRLHPELGFSFGYIGNLEPRLDDRRWSVFSKLSTRPDATACNVSWGRVATADLGDLAVRAAFGEMFDWADEQARALAAGKVFQVCPSAWLAREHAFAAQFKKPVCAL